MHISEWKHLETQSDIDGVGLFLAEGPWWETKASKCDYYSPIYKAIESCQ